MEVERLAIPAVMVLTPKRFHDQRGYFAETYNKRVLSDLGLVQEFVQDNHSHSAELDTIRGLHFQIPPRAQTKIVRVVSGSIFDVAVDIRAGSPTFGHHVSAVLSVDNGKQLLVPAGFAHGFCSLEASTEVLYKVTDYYSPEHDKGLLWSDPQLAIKWPTPATEALLSERDQGHSTLGELPTYFTYEP